MSDAKPTAPSERNAALDVLHGAALFGVVMVDLPMFFRPVWGEFDPAWAAAAHGAEAWVRGGVALFFLGKSLTMFAVLFGASFAILRRKFEGRDAEFSAHYARRMAALALIGIAQGVFLWYIGILVLLSAMGTACLALRGLEPPRRRALAAGLFAAGLVGAAASILASPGAAAGGNPAYFYHAGYLAGFEDGVYANGSWRAVTGFRAATFLFLIPPGLFLAGARMLAMMLLGAELQERGLFSDSPESRRFWSACLRRGAALGFPIQAVTVWTLFVAKPGVWILALRWASLYLGSAALCAAYMGAGCLWAWRAAPESRLKEALVEAGRMTLTNYLAFIAAASLLAYPYGLGLYDSLSEPALAGIGLLLYTAMLGGSGLWLGRFRFGPVEWLLRRAAYDRGKIGLKVGA